MNKKYILLTHQWFLIMLKIVNDIRLGLTGW